MELDVNLQNPVLHVVVVAFHHKKGCQVEYSYPPLVPGKPVHSSECPEQWKALPSLALPDGAHNYTEDTVYFHLPSLDSSHSTIYCVSCYRQMQATEVVNPTADMTRNTVQKSVCVLSKLPVYGLIQAKLELITHAYFQGRDFSQVTLLEDTYKTLNMSLNESLLNNSQVFVGLSCRELLQKFQHKLVILFKLMMLERRVLFYSSPVRPVCTSILELLSLFPGMIEHGIVEASSYTPSRVLSPTLQTVGDFVEVCYHSEKSDMTSSSDSQTLAAVQSSSMAPSSSTQNGSASTDWKTVEESLVKSHINADSVTVIPCQSGSLETTTDVSDIVLCDHSPLSSGDATVKNVTESPGVHSTHSRTGISLTDTATSSKTTTVSISSTDTVFSVVADDCTTVTVLDNKTNANVGSSANTYSQANASSTQMKTESIVSDSVDSVAVATLSAMNMEALLETEDELASWDADRLMLEIDEALSEAASSSDRTVSSPRDLPILSDTAAGDLPDGIHRVRREKDHSGSESAKLCRSNSLPSSLETDEFGMPLAIFTKGNLLHPYLSLHLFHLLSDVSVRGFVIGATNALFRQKTHLVDVVVEVADARIELHDIELRRQLSLTTADLRFADHLVRSISDEKGNIFLDSTEWEGGDDWLRAQFKVYLLSLCRTVASDDTRSIEDFNESFVVAWKTTHNYKQLRCETNEAFSSIPVGHPFQGQLSVSDVKLRLAQVLQNADRNKKINAVVSQTGRVVSQTGKAVGGAINSAKSAVTTWFGSFSGGKS